MRLEWIKNFSTGTGTVQQKINYIAMDNARTYILRFWKFDRNQAIFLVRVVVVLTYCFNYLPRRFKTGKGRREKKLIGCKLIE